jgi:hypothetical protein
MYRGPYPSWRRTLAGFVVAPLVAVLPLILINLDGRMSTMVMATLFGAGFGWAHALVSGLPLFLWLRRRRVAPTFLNCVYGGGAAAALPSLLATPWLGGVVVLVITFAIPLGAVGGAVFWLVACLGTQAPHLVAADVAEG